MRTDTQHQSYRVIVVDDNVAIRELMRKILCLGGHSVIAEAGNGVEAVDKYRQLRPELTIMDIRMPHKNGIEATRDILSINGEAKVVMCTSIDNHGVLLAAEGAGACGIIMKPFTYEVVHEIVDSVMRG